MTDDYRLITELQEEIDRLRVANEKLEDDNAARRNDQEYAARECDDLRQKLAEEQDKNEHLVEQVGDLKGDVSIREKEIEDLRSEIARLEGLVEDCE